MKNRIFATVLALIIIIQLCPLTPLSAVTENRVDVRVVQNAAKWNNGNGTEYSTVDVAFAVSGDNIKGVHAMYISFNAEEFALVPYTLDGYAADSNYSISSSFTNMGTGYYNLKASEKTPMGDPIDVWAEVSSSIAVLRYKKTGSAGCLSITANQSATVNGYNQEPVLSFRLAHIDTDGDGKYASDDISLASTSLSGDTSIAVVTAGSVIYKYDGTSSSTLDKPGFLGDAGITGEPATAISSVSTYVTVPVPGNSPATTVTTNEGAHCTASAAKWYQGATAGSTEFTGTFDYSTSYTVHFTLTCDSGYTFLDGGTPATISVNDAPSSPTVNEYTATVTYTFTTEERQDTPITSAILTLTEPVAGNAHNPAASSSEGFTVSTVWMKNTNGSYSSLLPGETFGYKSEYMATVTLTPKTGFVFSSLPETLTLNGVAVTNASLADGKVVINKLYFTAGQPVGSVDISVPEISGNLMFTESVAFSATSTAVAVIETAWFTSSGTSCSSGYFTPGESYFAVVRLEAVGNYELDDAATVLVTSGSDMTIANLSYNADNVCWQFETPVYVAKNIVTGLSLSIPSPEISGAPASATVSDGHSVTTTWYHTSISETNKITGAHAFESAKTYIAVIEITPSNAYTVFNIAENGLTFTPSSGAFTTESVKTADKITVTRTFNAMYTTISTLDLSSVISSLTPKTGETLVTSIPSASLPTGVASISIIWSPSASTASDNTAYTVVFNVFASAGYVFNESGVSITPVVSPVSPQPSNGKLTFSYAYPKTDIYVSAAHFAAVNVVAPVTDADVLPFVNAATVDEAGSAALGVSAVTWCPANYSGGSFSCDISGIMPAKFAASAYYAAQFTVTAKTGYIVNRSVAYTVPGALRTVITYGSGNTAMTVTAYYLTDAHVTPEQLSSINIPPPVEDTQVPSQPTATVEESEVIEIISQYSFRASCDAQGLYSHTADKLTSVDTYAADTYYAFVLTVAAKQGNVFSSAENAYSEALSQTGLSREITFNSATELVITVYFKTDYYIISDTAVDNAITLIRTGTGYYEGEPVYGSASAALTDGNNFTVDTTTFSSDASGEYAILPEESNPVFSTAYNFICSVTLKASAGYGFETANIVETDGNKKTVRFILPVLPRTLTFTEESAYSLITVGEMSCLKGVKDEIKVSDMLGNLTNNPDAIKVFTADGEEITDTSVAAASRQIIRLISAGKVLCEYHVIIPGDIFADGYVDIKDVFTLVRHLTFPSDYPLDALALACAEVDSSNGEVNIDDANKIRRYIANPEIYPILN